MAEEVLSIEWVDPATGQKYLNNRLGGTTDSAGKAAGNMVLPDGIGALNAGENLALGVTGVVGGPLTGQFQDGAGTLDCIQNAGGFLSHVVPGPLGVALTGTITVYDETTGGSTLIIHQFQAGEIISAPVYFNRIVTQGLQVVIGNAADQCSVHYISSPDD